MGGQLDSFEQWRNMIFSHTSTRLLCTNFKGNVAMNVWGFSKNGLSKSRGLICNGDFIELDHDMDFQSTGYTPILHPVFKTIIFTSYLAISWKQSLCPCPPWSPTDDWIRWTACGPKWPTKRESAGRVACPFFGCMPDIVLRKSSNFRIFW